MNTRIVKVTAPSRLHFGMFSFGHAGQRQYGGVGVMIDRPGLALTIRSADSLEVSGPLADRAREVTLRLAGKLSLAGPPNCRIDVLHAPPDHVGLGAGTQLNLALAAGLNAWLGRRALSVEELIDLTGRGERSAIGAYGFDAGGLLVEAGKRPGETLSPLAARVELPSEWRFVLIAAADVRGLSGEAERKAFDQLPAVPPEVTQELARETLLEMLPAATNGDFSAFSKSLYRYGHLAGMCFAAQQGGAYADERSAALVAAIRRRGVAGVGQSSWGPTIFALLPGQAEAEDFAASIGKENLDAELAIWIAGPDNRGALVELIK